MEHTETIKKNYEFRRLYAKGKSAVTPTLAVYTRRQPRGLHRHHPARPRRDAKPRPAASAGDLPSPRSRAAPRRGARCCRALAQRHRCLQRAGAGFSPRLPQALTAAGGYCPVKAVLLWLIRFYRKNISPRKPPCCRFIPTCSQYALEAIEKYGAAKGGWLAFKRICRCHPFHTGEHDFYDPVP